MITAAGMGEPGLDVLSGGTGGVAGRQEIDVDGTTVAVGPRAGAGVSQIRESSQIQRPAGPGVARVHDPTLTSRHAGGPETARFHDDPSVGGCPATANAT